MRIDVETPFFDSCRRFDKSDLLDMYPDKEGFISLMLMLIKETDALKRRVDILKEVEKEFKKFEACS